MISEPEGRFIAVASQRAQGATYDRRGRQVPSPNAVPDQAAIHGAAMRGLNPVIEFLAAHGANLQAKDAQGKTPLDLAMGNYNENFRSAKIEPLVETVALLEKLIAASDAQASNTQANNSE